MKIKKQQLEFMDWEFGAFFHFGIRSCFLGHKDWDGKEMSLSEFNPTELDCEQWIREFKNAGAKYAILTAKHHDGFANWPSKYTEFSVKNTPWKNGKGDVVREYVDACHKYDMKVGLYYSPAQWGNKAVAAFQNGKDYDDYFINQLSELLTNYGVIDYLWFDGNGSGGHEYDWDRIFIKIHEMQPNILVFGEGKPDVRWIGNEDGYAPLPNINVVNDSFLPGECDTNMRSTWFDCEKNDDTVYEVDELVGLYMMSVGRGANFLLNIGPTCKGILPSLDVDVLRKFSSEIKRRFSSPIDDFCNIIRVDDTHFKIEADTRHLIDTVVIMEDMSCGGTVREFKLWSGDNIIYNGLTIAHKAICTFPTVKTNEITLQITKTESPFDIKNIRCYYTK
ncbi:MAG: alpha-L-fucosidase [Oscillospiraceae bacterium]